MKIFRHIKSLTVAAFALALLCIAFASTTKVQADDFTAAYDPETDSVVITAADKSVFNIFTLKDATATLTDKSKAAVKNVTVSGSSVSVPLNDKKAGLKVAENKPLYLYIAPASGAAIDGKTANFKLAATEVKKISSITFDYTKAYENNSDFAITVKYVKDGVDAEQTATVDKLVISDIRGKDKAPNATFTSEERFTGDVLYALITDTEKKNGKDSSVKHKLNVQILGSSQTVTVSGETFNGQRNAKVKSVSPKAAAKAPKAKIDHVKGTIALKSGFDFVVRTTKATTSSAIEASEWKTVLPYAETGKVTDAYYISSQDYKYYKKADTDTTAPNYFTSKGKLKGLDLTEICGEVWNSEDAVSGTAIIYVRKTATDKAPASLVSTEIEVIKPAAAPSATSGTAIALSDTKGKFPKSTTLTGANANGSYEILVVKESLINKIDMTKVKWTKYDPTKTFKTKLSSKITYTDTTPAETVSALKEDGTPEAGVVILIRGTGVKEKRNAAGYLATEIAKTKFVAVGTGDSAKISWEFVPQN